MNKTAIFTISSNNYFAFSKTVLQSVRKFRSEVDLFFLLVDETVDDKIQSQKNDFEICLARDIGIAKYKQMAFAYNMVEFNTAVKPFFIQYLFQKGYQKVIYLDPDILVCNPLDLAMSALDDHALALTPHQLSPVGNLDGFVPFLQWEQSALLTGLFNLGFIGVANTDQGRDFIEWWCNRCTYMCFVDPEAGLFVDQKLVDLAVCFYSSIYIVRHKGYNMSVWNLHDRELRNGQVNGVEPLVFYHFSSIDMHDPDIISRHDTSLRLTDRQDLAELFRAYRQTVQENGYDYFRSLPYSYDYFLDGRKINVLERQLYASVSNDYSDPFSTPSRQFMSVLRQKRRSMRKAGSRVNHAFFKRIAMSGMRMVFKLSGPERYIKITQFMRGKDKLRGHAFLLD